MAASSAFLFLLLAIPAVYGAQHIVGGSSGWTNFGVDYDTWAAGETFTVGDTLVFTYGSNHQVAETNEGDYNSCSSSNAIATHSGGSTTVTLSKSGPKYFICPTGGHCGSGMKLSVNVMDASTTPGTTPATPTPSGGNTTPTPEAGTPPSTTSSRPPPPSGNGADSLVRNLMVGALVVFGSTVTLMC
ncbi:uclacyanin-2-like [Mercurialis annua]|uniref:uclacyanin-2-like n=1 Tax=Mercurialis annua TaxID=3986 RepID=UPI00216000FA|nr:uclacyanin-2-like [Mercurialis annua]